MTRKKNGTAGTPHVGGVPGAPLNGGIPGAPLNGGISSDPTARGRGSASSGSASSGSASGGSASGGGGRAEPAAKVESGTPDPLVEAFLTAGEIKPGN
ncbi:hypothetical protein ACIBI3_11505 [Actinomadura luteofluorescens]|uniref:hypothetical protein n=1 Tax=Actinomadura luteofluorescens TaxID=46163 RepID=UPI0034906E45